jgi:hypothetical protein
VLADENPLPIRCGLLVGCWQSGLLPVVVGRRCRELATLFARAGEPWPWPESDAVPVRAFGQAGEVAIALTLPDPPLTLAFLGGSMPPCGLQARQMGLVSRGGPRFGETLGDEVGCESGRIVQG